MAITSSKPAFTKANAQSGPKGNATQAANEGMIAKTGFASLGQNGFPQRRAADIADTDDQNRTEHGAQSVLMSPVVFTTVTVGKMLEISRFQR